jgi:hypothetical protein
MDFAKHYDNSHLSRLLFAWPRSLPVYHPEFVAVGQRRAVVIGENDSWSWIKPLLVVSLDSLPKSKKSGNGKGRRTK